MTVSATTLADSQQDVQLAAVTSAEVAKRDLAAAFARIVMTINAKSPKPTLQCVKLTIADDCIELEGTNLEQSHYERIPAVSCCESVSCIVNAKAARKAVTSFSGRDLSVSIESDCVRIGNSKLKILPLNEHPKALREFQPEDFSDSWESTAEDLQTMLAFCNPAADPDSFRFALGGTRVEFCRHDVLRTIGTDGRRLHCASESIQWHLAAEHGAIAPIAAVKTVVKILAKAGTVRVELTKTGELQFSAFNGGQMFARLQTRTIDGRFPNWQDVRPDRTKCGKIFTAAAADLAGVYKAAACIIDKRSDEKRTILRSAGDKLAVETPDSCQVENQFKMHCDCIMHDSFKICFNPHYMYDAIGGMAAAKSSTIEACSSSGNSPLLLESDCNRGRLQLTAVIMPLAIDR